MKKKHILAVILVMGLLAAAFFLGGKYDESEISIDENNTQTQLVKNNNKLSQSEETQKNEEYDVKAGIKTEKADENMSESEAKKRAISQSGILAAEKSEKADMKAQQDEQLTQKVKSAIATNSVENKTEKAASDVASKKDKYLTDPIPEGKPKPIEWQSATIDTEKKLTCVLSISCKTILDNMEKFNKDKLEVLPADGIIFIARKVNFYEGESVFDVLLREMKSNKIHMEFEMTPIYNSNYIEGIHNLYEFDCGELSGWMYKVNGWFPNYGCSRYLLKDGDNVEWVYTCDLGRDVGGGMAVGGEGG